MDSQAWREQQSRQGHIRLEKHTKNQGTHLKALIKAQLHRPKVLIKYFPLQ